MPCYKPLQGWRSRFKNESGKRSIVFNLADGYADMPVEVPCGRCIGCRLERSRQWAIRCMHEASLHDENCFLTLTYDEAHLPSDGGLRKRDMVLFNKRLRKHFKGRKIRYFQCGEYGDENKRPHYHSIVFGLDPADKVLYSETNGNRLFVSETLNRIWGMGEVWIGAVTFESAAYVARYVMKKVSINDRTPDHLRDTYKRLIVETGEVVDVSPEFVSMSLKPAIAAGWYDRFASDVFPSDSVIVRGREMKPPKYYTLRLEKTSPESALAIKGRRTRLAKQHSEDSTPSRLRVREKVKEAAISQLTRKV